MYSEGALHLRVHPRAEPHRAENRKREFEREPADEEKVPKKEMHGKERERERQQNHEDQLEIVLVRKQVPVLHRR